MMHFMSTVFCFVNVQFWILQKLKSKLKKFGSVLLNIIFSLETSHLTNSEWVACLAITMILLKFFSAVWNDFIRPPNTIKNNAWNRPSHNDAINIESLWVRIKISNRKRLNELRDAISLFSNINTPCGHMPAPSLFLISISSVSSGNFQSFWVMIEIYSFLMNSFIVISLIKMCVVAGKFWSEFLMWRSHHDTDKIALCAD